MTLLQMREAAKDLCDHSDNSNVDDLTWTRWINDGIERLYRIASKRNVGLFQVAFPFSLSGSTNTVTFPTGMRRLIGVTKDPGIPAQRRSLPKYNFGERDSMGLWGPVGYHVTGNQTISIEPAQLAAGNYALYYVAGPTILAADTDVIDPVLEPYDDYVTTWAAIKALGREESDNRDLYADLAAIEQSVDEMFALSDGDDPATIVDDDRRGPVIYTVP